MANATVAKPGIGSPSEPIGKPTKPTATEDAVWVDAEPAAVPKDMPKTWRDDPIASAVHDAFTLGFDLVELRSRVVIAAEGIRIAAHGAGTATEVSHWRAVFSRIMTMHAAMFPESSTQNTLYDPGKSRLPYLYPQSLDYANIGVPGLGATLEKFSLCETTRRAVNCLTLLHLAPPDSLAKDDVERLQLRVVTEISKPKVLASSAAPSKAEMSWAIKRLTELVVSLLDAWDGYVRENFFTQGALKDDDLERTAYEAGRAMASLSWGMSVKTLVALRVGAADLEANDALGDSLFTQWQLKFDQPSVVRLQHMLSALGGALDGAFHRAHPKAPGAAGEEALTPFNPHLPSKSLHAVHQGLEYWHRTIAWMAADTENPWSPSLASDMHDALVAQVAIWHSLVTGRQDLTGFSAKSVTEKIMQDLMADLENAARAEIAAEGARQVKELARSSERALEAMLGGSKRTIAILGGLVGLVMLALVAVFLLGNHGEDVKSMTSGGAATLTALIAWLGSQHITGHANAARRQIKESAENATENASDPEGGSALGTVKGLTSGAGEAVQSAFLKGYKQLRVELAELDYCVSATYPLIELVIVRSAKLKGKGSHGFLTEVIWSESDRKEQLHHVALAAFGPMASFARSIRK